MSRARTTFLGAVLGSLVLSTCLASAAAVQWYEEGREIGLCNAAKDFWDENERAPRSIAELPEPYASETTTRDGRSYTWRCDDDGGDVPVCGLSWPGDEHGAVVGRACGRLDERDWIDWL